MKRDGGWAGCQHTSQPDGSTMLQNSNSGTRVHSQTQFMGSVEKESFLSRRREELTKSRIAEVRKQESQATKSSVTKLKEEQARLAEEQRLLEEYRVYQQKQREKERLEKEKEEVLRAWRDNQEQTRLEAQTQAKKREEHEKREKEQLEKKRERGREALEKEEEARRQREREDWARRETREKIARTEGARTEAAVKEAREREEKKKAEDEARQRAGADEVSRMRGDVLNGYGAHRKRFGMKEFENSNSRVGAGLGPLVVKEEPDDQEDAAALAEEAAMNQRLERQLRQERDAVSRERAKSREKVAREKEVFEKQRQDIEKHSHAQKISIEQAKVELAREGERNRLIGMKQREEEVREEDRRQRRLESEFESLFFGVSRTVGDEYLGERIAHQAYWKDPCEILYETKKTREWGPKNKKRDLNVPDLDRLVAERRASRERSQGSHENSGASRSRSPKLVPGGSGDRYTSKSRSGFEKDEEVSFHCTEMESEYGKEQSYARQQLLDKYRGRDPRDSLEMTLSEDQSVMPRGSGFGSLGTDMSRFLEEQERMIQRLERDRAELNKQIQLQENAVGSGYTRQGVREGEHAPYSDEDAEIDEEDISGRVLYSQDLARQPWMHMQDGLADQAPEEPDEHEPQPEDEEILGKFLTFQPDSKWESLGAQKNSKPEPVRLSNPQSQKGNKPPGKKSTVRFDLKARNSAHQQSPDLTYSDTEGDIINGQNEPAAAPSNINRSRPEPQNEEGNQPRGRSREEALALRKKMMKYNPLEASGMAKKNPAAAPIGITLSQSPSHPVRDQHTHTGNSQEGLPNPALLSRLAKGEKVQVPKEEMLKLTNKNYQNLPEVRHKEAERQRKENAKMLREKQKNFGKELRSRSRDAVSPEKSS